jgi:hypothetical protein
MLKNQFVIPHYFLIPALAFSAVEKGVIVEPYICFITMFGICAKVAENHYVSGGG